MFKKTLRQHLASAHPSQELNSWFDPLDISIDGSGNTVHVAFPHVFFSRWFMESKKNDFERGIKHLNNGMEIVYQDVVAQYDAPFVFSPGGPSAEQQPPHKVKKHGEFSETIKVPAKQQTFDSFLVNKKNEFPLAVIRDLVAKIPTPPYSLLILHGHSGSGKSHLLNAMAHELQTQGHSFFFGGMDFFNTFRLGPGHYAERPESCVILDNLQSVCACPNIQEDLTALIDLSQRQGKLLSLGFDVHPISSSGLGQKLRSRLSAGLILELKRPDLDIRRQYVQRQNTMHQIGLTKEEGLNLAQRYQDIRSINGALSRLAAYRTLLRREDGDDTAPNITAILERGSDISFLTPAFIVNIVARYFSVAPDDLIGKSREKSVSTARHIAILLCRELLGLSLVRTGRFFGGRDHSSVLYSIKKVKQLQKSNRDMNNQIEELRKLCINRQQ